MHPQQQQQDSLDDTCTAADTPSRAGVVEQHIERPCTPQQHLQELLRASTGVLTPVSECDSCCHDGGAAEADWQDWDSSVAEPWATLPEAVFADIITLVSGADVG